MRHRIPLPIPLLLLLAVGIFIPGINWGLPAVREIIDPFLFGNHPRWSGQQILGLAGPTEDRNRGADVASHPAGDRTGVVTVNLTDEDRARIIRRYRLMSCQPDEWNTLKALSEMKPHEGNFDPKLYQYGGLWVYPVGALLKVAAMLHLIDVRADVAWYLDHPQAFGRFYVVARLWSVIWALVGVCAVYALVSRIVAGRIFPTMAAASFIFMPVVVNMAHEAKPHLAGAVLMLLAVLAASRYVEHGHRSAWILAGALCGAALAMVLSTLPVLLVLPVMVVMRSSAWRQRITICGRAVAIAVAVYLVTNPYVPINFISHRGLLESNLGNSGAMYHAQLTRDGIRNALHLIAAGTSPPVAIVGTVGAIALGIRAWRFRNNREPAEIRRRSTGLLLAIPSLWVIGQCILVATGKPGEFARFMLLPGIFLMIEAMVALGTQWRESPDQIGHLDSLRSSASLRTWLRQPCHVVAFLLLVSTAIPGLIYDCGFVRDSRMSTARLIEAEQLRRLTADGRKTLAIYADPAPYCLPPVDLFDAPILLLPKGSDAAQGVKQAKVSIRPVDVPVGGRWFFSPWTTTPISWADKPFDVR